MSAIAAEPLGTEALGICLVQSILCTTTAVQNEEYMGPNDDNGAATPEAGVPRVSDKLRW